jgi:hypothetical protein
MLALPLVVVLLLLASVGTASAECAWVLWAQTVGGAGILAMTFGAWPTREECEKARLTTVAPVSVSTRQSLGGAYLPPRHHRPARAEGEVSIQAILEGMQRTLGALDWDKIIGPVIGFLVAWALFELTERRKVRLAQQALRVALVAELRHAEILLSSIVGKYSYTATTPHDVAAFAAEVRWFAKEGKARAMQHGLALTEHTPEQMTAFKDASDAQIIQVLKAVGAKETSGTTLILPIVDAVLSGRTPGFSDKEIQALSTVRWQVHLLAEDAAWTKEFVRLSFTVTGPNHGIVSDNHDRRVQSYGRRAITLIACVRSALKTMEAA